MWYENSDTPYGATILTRYKTPNDDRIQPKQVVRKKGD
jgi:hypothetical protein